MSCTDIFPFTHTSNTHPELHCCFCMEDGKVAKYDQGLVTEAANLNLFH